MTESMDFDEMNKKVVAEFRDNSGKVGGIFAGTPLVLDEQFQAVAAARRVVNVVEGAQDRRC